MHRIVLALALASATVFGSSPAAADPVRAEAAASDLSSQSARPQRARTRIRVTPAPRTGRLARECDFHLAREVRASGSYVVPRQRCWWTRQR